METILGTLITAVVAGVLAFAREQIKNSREDARETRGEVKFYRDQLLPAFERLTDLVENALNRSKP